MPLRGDLASFSLAEIFQFLSVNQSSGTLTVSDGENTRTLAFRGGVLTPVGEAQSYVPRFGEFLVRRGLITAAQLAATLELQKAGGGRKLGEIILAEGFATPEKVRDALRAKLEEEIYDLFLWKNAFFDFVRDETLPGGPAEATTPADAPGFNTSALLMEALRRVDEWGPISESVPSLRWVFVRTEKPPAEGGLAATPLAARLLPALSPEHSVRELIEKADGSKFDVCKVLDGLRREGVVRPLPADALALAFDDALRRGALDVCARQLEYALELGAAAGTPRERMWKALLGERGAGAGSPTIRVSGAAETVDLPVILQAALLRRLTGTLRLRDLESERVVSVTPAEIAIHATGSRESARLGQVLLQQGAITQRQLDAALTVQRDDPRRLGELLVARKVVAQAVVDDAVLRKVGQELLDLFLWRNAWFEFATGPAPAPKAGLRPTRLALEGGTAHKDLVGRIAWAAEVLHRISSSRAILVPTGRDQRRRRPGGADDAETEILALVNGVRTVSDLFPLTRRANTEVLETLSVLQSQGLVRPITLDEVRHAAEGALRAGQVEGCLKLCRYGTELAPADPGLAQLVSEAAGRRTDAGEATREYRLEGDLQSFSLAELVQSLYLNKHSGTLQVRDGRREKVIYFAQGHMALLTRGESEVGRLGDILVDQGRVSELDVERALEAQQGTGKRLGEVLVELGLVTAEDVQQALEMKVRDELFDAFLWRGATFVFLKNYFPDEFSSPDARVTRLALDTTRTLMEAIARMERWEALGREFGTLKAILRQVSGVDVHGCARRARQLLPLVDGRRPIAELAEDATVGRFAALEALDELRRAGAVRPLTLDELNAEAERAFEERAFDQCVAYYEYALHLDESNAFLRQYLAQAKGSLASLDTERVRTKSFDLVKLVRAIVAGGHTGTLTAKDGPSTRQVYLGRDEMAVWSEGPRPTASLRALAERGGVPERALQRAVEFQTRTGRDLAEVLVKQGACTPEQCQAFQRDQVWADCEDLFRWREANLEFERNVYPPRFDEPGVSVQRLTTDVAAFLTALADRRDEWERYRNAVPSERLIFAVAPRDPAAGPLPRRLKENPVLAHVDGRRAVPDLLAAAGLPEFEGFRALHDLVTARVIRPLAADDAVRAGEAAWVFRDLAACEALFRHALELDRSNTAIETRLEQVRKGRETAVRRRLSTAFADHSDLPGLLATVVREQRWGTLEATFEDRVRMLHLAPDRLRFLAAGARRGRRLGERLVQWGQATDAQIVKALAAQKRTPRLLGQILTLQGVLTDRALDAALREKLLDDLHELFAWQNPKLRYQEGDPPGALLEPGRGVTELATDTAALVREALEREGAWREIGEVLPDERVIFARKDGASGESRRADATGTKNPVLALINGHRSVAAVVAESDAGRFEALRAFVRLVRNNVIAPLGVEQARAAAQQAFLSNDLGTAVTLLRYAVGLAPDDAELKRRLERIEQTMARTRG